MNNKDDERLRKTTIAFLKDFADKGYENAVECIDWLKKQGEKKPALDVEIPFSAKDSELKEKQGEQKPNPCDGCINRKGCINCENGELRETEQKPNPYSGTSFECNGHTWGMCARDGGVEILVDGHVKGRVFTNDNNAKEMFIKALERVEEENAKGYKLTDCDKNSWWEDFKSYVSCTFEQKSAWSEEDENWLIDAINVCELYGYNETAGWLKNRLKFLKERVQTKQEWSEEDERSIRDSIFYLKSAKKYFEKDDDILWNEKWFNLCIKFLESLYKKLQPQSQWKPSEEQMEALESATENCAYSEYQDCLRELIGQLKKLREE